MGSSLGLATAFLAANKVYGNYWDVDPEEALDKNVYEAKWPKSEYFIIDVQTHFAELPNLPGNFAMLPFRNMEWVSQHGNRSQEQPRLVQFS